MKKKSSNVSFTPVNIRFLGHNRDRLCFFIRHTAISLQVHELSFPSTIALDLGLFDDIEEVHNVSLSAQIPVLWSESDCITVSTATDASN